MIYLQLTHQVQQNHSLRIKDNEAESFELTCRSNMVAVVSDGTRVLGLGDIGAAAALPVMEGKSLLFKKFGDVDCIPLVVDTKRC